MTSVHSPLAEGAVLRDNALFSGVDGAALVRVLSGFQLAMLPKDAVLYACGGVARSVFLIVSGSVAVVQQTAGARTIVAHLGPGEFTGERALLRPRGRQRWSAVCCQESWIAFTDGDTLLAALTELPAIGVNVARALHRRVVDVTLAIEEMIAGS